MNNELSNLMATFRGNNNNDMLLIMPTETDIKFVPANPNKKMTPGELSTSIVNWILSEMDASRNFYVCYTIKNVLHNNTDHYKKMEVEPLVHMFSQVCVDEEQQHPIHIIVLKIFFDFDLKLRTVVASTDPYTLAVFKEVETKFNTEILPTLLLKLEGA